MALFFALLFHSGCQEKERRILVFTRTLGFHHESIPAGQAFFQKWGKEKGVRVDTTSNPRWFRDDSLRHYHSVVFLNTTGDVLNRSQEAAFERYIQSGGGFVGIHSATDTEYEWEWYGKLTGAYFSNHPEIQTARIFKPDSVQSSLLDGIPGEFRIEDEWYNFLPGSLNSNCRPLLFLDENSYQGGKHGKSHPAAWFHEFDGGRAFYTVLGHRNETYSNPTFTRLLENALQWTTENGSPRYSRARSENVPDEDRFSRQFLSGALDEPMELAVEPNGSVWVVGRKGQIWRWDEALQNFSLRQILPVWTKYEDGLLGITLDVHFEETKWVYLFYSPNGAESVQHVSRFSVIGDSLDKSSEKILLKIPVQREECCHSGGSLTMDQNGLLWISTGDNTNPHKSDGYAPIDERPGRYSFDAQKSSSNTQDLRGKILRIKPTPDGGYSIPKGNLFPPGTPKTRPEIYAMGCRNPFRLSVSPDGTGLAWGDVGPDAGKDSVYGPKGHDEVNLTYEPGFFGWPYFIGPNLAYTDRNFSDSIPPGLLRDPAKSAVNNSPNSGGQTHLPLAKPAWMYYPYLFSPVFPSLGKGGRTAMAGPWIPSQGQNLQLPGWYRGKLLVYDWMRGWIFAAQPHPEAPPRLERVLSKFRFSKPMDMELGKDGALYILEYGENWFVANSDARLSRIRYSLDNHAPVAKLEASSTIGGVPFTVRLSGRSSFDEDPDEKLHFEWRIGNPSQVYSTEPEVRYTFRNPGLHTVRLVVTDTKGKSSVTSTVVQVGNHPPRIRLRVSGNSTFYFPGSQLGYFTEVWDKEDGSLADGGIAPGSVSVFRDVLKQTLDKTLEAQGHQSQREEEIGKNLIGTSDCKSCHQEKVRSAGPSWVDIAKRYKTQGNAVSLLARKVIKGGAGVWGDHAMSAHPQLSDDDARKMVRYILSLGSLPNQVHIQNKGTFGVPSDLKPDDRLMLTAVYRDRGALGIDPLESRGTLDLRHPRIGAQESQNRREAFEKSDYGKAPYFMRFYKEKAYISFDSIDLQGIKRVVLRGVAFGTVPLTLELRLDSPDGELVGSRSFKAGKVIQDFTEHALAMERPVNGKHSIFLVLNSGGLLPKKDCSLALEWAEFHIK